jgi:iron complex transport system substrate-binding protein
MNNYPQRIICLTEETTETLYLLGCQDRIVGISGFTVRPQEARREKPKVSTFLDANIDKIIALKPDVVFTFSDLQAEIAKELIARGIQVVAFNQRSVREILQMILIIGGIVGKSPEAEALVERFEHRLNDIAARSGSGPRPRVYFEEWGNPLISGICWVSELIEIAGGEDIFRELRTQHSARNRIVQPEDVVNRNPDIIIGSWCGRPFKKEQVRLRPGWERISAVQNNRLYEITSSIILQPGPAALTDGLDALVHIIQHG